MTQAVLDREALLDQIAERIRHSGFQVPIIAALQFGHPLTFLGGQMLWVTQPALSLFFPSSKIRELAQLLEDPASLQGLLKRLEAGEV